MTREQRIVQVFVELTSTMVEEYDVIDFLHRVAERSVELLDCAEAGLLVADAAGALRVMASSSERSEALEVLQSQNDEGPCYESYQRGAPVFSEDLRADAGRWPRFAPSAIEKGFRSVESLPMRVGAQTIGALNLFRTTEGRLDGADLPLAQGLADIAAVALLHERAARDARGVVEQLQAALSSRVVIEQAKGVLAERAGIGVDAAFGRMRAYARSHNRRLREVAREIIDGQLDAAVLADPETASSDG